MENPIEEMFDLVKIFRHILRNKEIVDLSTEMKEDIEKRLLEVIPQYKNWAYITVPSDLTEEFEGLVFVALASLDGVNQKDLTGKEIRLIKFMKAKVGAL